ncbi:hypothetical protein J6590_106769, partial [Homalodisca vitripennis]
REVPQLWAEQSQAVRSRTTVVPGLRDWNLTSTWSCLELTWSNCTTKQHNFCHHRYLYPIM